MSFKYFFISFVFIILINPGFAQIATFHGGDFSVDANWEGGTKPGPNANIVIAAWASMNVNENYTCHSLTINTGSSFSCSGGSVLTIGTGGIYDENGDLAISVSSSLQISSGIEVNPAASGSFTDSRDGQTYNWVRIGNQVWMAENLKYMSSVVGPGTSSNTVPYYYVYSYDGTSVGDAKATPSYTNYGVLYNWPAAMAGAGSSATNPSGVQGICPVGWHLPSDAEWTELENFLTTDGHSGTEGDALKTTSLWVYSGNGTDDYRFSGFPRGYRSSDGNFYGLGYFGYWWSSTGFSSYYAWFRGLSYYYTTVERIWDGPDNGMSVRCVKN